MDQATSTGEQVLLELCHYRGRRAVLVLTEVASYDDSFEDWDASWLVTEERRLFLRGGNRGLGCERGRRRY